jgi:hypothetical protein
MTEDTACRHCRIGLSLFEYGAQMNSKRKIK